MLLTPSTSNRITDVEVRTKTEQRTMDNILREKRLRWLGHVLHMGHQRIPQQALYWQVPWYKRGPGRPANWRSTINKDLQKMKFTWEEAQVAALDSIHGWRRSVAQCVQLNAGWTKVQGQGPVLCGVMLSKYDRIVRISAQCQT